MTSGPIQDQKLRARMVQETIKTEGWLLVLQPDLIKDTDDLKEKLINEPSLDKMREYQMELRAIQRLFKHIAELAVITP